MSLPFLPDLHNEVSGSWEHLYSACMAHSVSNYLNVEGLSEWGHGRTPRVERNVANDLSPGKSSSLKAAVLPSKPCQMTSRLVGKEYVATGRIGGALHIMKILQVYQADLFKDLWEIYFSPGAGSS